MSVPTTERDWDQDFDLAAWQAVPAAQRNSWLEGALGRERDDEDVYASRRKRYERGQTAWDIGLDPQPFDVTLSMAIDVVKPEHWDGVVFGSRDVRHRVLSALLANAGLGRTLRLAPRQVWEQTIQRRAALATQERALAADRRLGTHIAPRGPVPRSRPDRDLV
jgi:hypothetical protein